MTVFTECHGGQLWKKCGASCVHTCLTSKMRCYGTCVDGCACPWDRPIWHEGKCITVEKCPSSYKQCCLHCYSPEFCLAHKLPHRRGQDFLWGGALFLTKNSDDPFLVITFFSMVICVIYCHQLPFLSHLRVCTAPD